MSSQDDLLGSQEDLFAGPSSQEDLFAPVSPEITSYQPRKEDADPIIPEPSSHITPEELFGDAEPDPQIVLPKKRPFKFHPSEPVRKMSARRKLIAEPCKSCQGYWLATGLTGKELEECIQSECKHRTLTDKNDTVTPEVWELEITTEVIDGGPTSPLKKNR